MARAASTEAAPANPAQPLELYRQMVLIRRFEEEVQRLFMRGLVHGTTHLYSGEEASAVGVCSALEGRDRVAGTYRGHGHALARGTDPGALMAELLGRSTGVCGGRGGSMNLIDIEHGVIGCFGIIGGSIGAATGAGLALRGTGAVAVAFFGEGTTNHGYFHECLNFAKVLSLPVVYVCENNGYGEFTPYQAVTAGVIADRPGALGLPATTVDGMDVLAVREASLAAVERARAGGGPQFLETLVYRFVGHSRSDPARYRPEGELEKWQARDPLTVARAGLSDAAADEVDAEVAAVLERAVAGAIDAPFPDPDVALREFKD